MAKPDTSESGICAWMSSVRASMANDPCRQLFEDQVQTHAFIFLDDYLEHILAGPKQGPIIELVKTPGRKKNMPRRTRAATAAAAKVKNTTLLSLDCDNSTKDVVPVNSFHKALLQARERSTQDPLDAPKSPPDLPSTSNGSAAKTHGRAKSVQVANIPQITVLMEPELLADATPLQQSSRNLQSESSTPFPAPERGTALSVIAEGDESPERSHADIVPLSTIASDQGGLSDSVPRFRHEAEEYPATEGDLKIILIDPMSQGDTPPDGQYPVLSPVNAYHSIPLDSPPEGQSPEAGTGNHTEPLPSRTAINSPRNCDRNAFTAPLPVVPASNSIPIPHTIFVPLNDSSPRASAQKSGIAGFPMLPAPSPLRKSMRVAQEALTGSALPTPAPAPVPLGKRTSWLMKAREAKAMEGTSSLPGTSAAATSTAFPRVSTAVKRKSGEMHGAIPPGLDWDKDQRKPKVAKSTEVGIAPLIPKETENTDQRGIPSAQGEPIALSSVVAAMPMDHLESHAMDVDEQITPLNSAEEGFIDLFKRTVEGLGARTGKSMGKSLGGAAVAALAEARAAAEAKVAERNKVNTEVLHDDGLPDQEPLGTREHSDDQFPYLPTPQAEGAERRLSLSDLAPGTVLSNEPELSTKMAQVMNGGTRINSCDESVSTTPPDSPPLKGSSSFVKPAGPVFNKPPPPPVFMPPPAASKQSSVASGQPKEFSFNFPPGQFTLPVAVPLGIPARLTSPSDGLPSMVRGTSQMFVQPSQSSPSSDPIFDNRDEVPTWDPSTQDTLYTIDSQPRDAQCATAIDDDDDDDSWPLEEKLAAAEPGWRPFDFSNVDKEDTWSSLPTESQGPTRSLTTEKNGVVTLANDTDAEAETNDEEMEREQETVEISDAGRSMMEVSELEEAAEAGMASLRRVGPIARSTSQTSMASTASSSLSQAGFFSQATKLVNSMLGGGKKAKPELKSLQLAAAAAKRQQEEADKKIQRLKDMEARRQVANAKKAEEERTRLLEEDKKSKEEFEKRKREREENTDRRQLKLPVSTKKVEDDASKKRRLAPEVEKKPESKKPPSKDKKDLAAPTKSVVTPATKLATQKGAKATTTALVSSTAYNATQNAPPPPSAKPLIPEAKPFKVVPSKGKAKTKPQEDDMGDKLPSTMVQSQMAARAKAQMQAAKLPTPEVPSESIELPEINSEYSDSEDEDRVRAFDPPGWAQSPELRQALQMQSTVNPDNIFGAIRPLRMEEMFRTRQSRFRARTSSANWSGSDRLTVEEIHEYERRMGFQQTLPS
ncbi:hypothetical protein OG21DRAFT_1452349 [Imleria badia]|nr:hypothetical protein OG21DRAFT_1452349 [Imleria badia]